MNKLRLVVNNKLNRKENFFIKKELQTILNLYAQKVSCGDWKDYGLSINRKEISFDIYHRTSEVPIFKISKNLNPKNKIEKFYILDKNSNVIKQSENLENLINKTKWEKLRLVK
jgi:ribosomal protein S24E